MLDFGKQVMLDFGTKFYIVGWTDIKEYGQTCEVDHFHGKIE